MKLYLNKKLINFSILIFIMILSSCTTTPTEQQSVFTVSPDSATTLPTETEAISTPTETLQIKNLVLLIKNENFKNEEMDIKNQLDQFAQSRALNYELVHDFDENLISSAELVVVMDPEENWINLSANFSNATFLFISEKQLPLSKNGYQIKLLPAEFYFLAGYTSALVSNDWRISGILPDISYDNTSAAQLFSNGVHYLCGLCLPVYTPLVRFPVTASLSSTANQDSIFSAISELSVNRPETVYIQSEFLTSETSIDLRNNGLTIISNQNTGTEADLLPDLSIYQEISTVLKSFLNSFGENQQKVMPADFAIESNNSFLSSGKLDNLNTVINDLRDGFIYPATIQE